MAQSYPFAQIEPKWQRHWLETGLFECDATDTSRPLYFCLTMYPYPSGALHMGHVINYSIGDALVRFHLMRGENVLSPMGWDSFGLPAENAAIRAGVNPRDWTTQNIDQMREQMRRAGWGYDWRREVATSHPGYYRWTQWLFLQFYRAGLAYRKQAPVNWCPTCQTVLANEQVHDGGCERCGSLVEQRDLEQWFFAMSKYAQRLLDGHAKLAGKWPERVLKMQKEWIGRSEGALLDFTVEAPGTSVHGETLSVFTTRPDTTYGVTFMAIPPEHPFVEPLLSTHPRREEAMTTVRRLRNVTAMERTSEESEKEGLPTGHYVLNPFDGARAELFIVNYALMEYATGAVMGVPAHDQRDFMFARKYGIPVRVVIQPEGEELDGETMTEAYVDPGVQVNSGPFDGMPNEEAKRAMTEFVRDKGKGDFTVNYRLRDWLVSRQRYWGAPIPIVYCQACGEVPVPDEELPVLLPSEVEFSPTGESPLTTCQSFVQTTCPSCGGPARRETDTMDTFVDSSWYFLRYLSPRKTDGAFDPALCNRWLPVHQYTGGIEHATMHLIYARFVTMVLHDLGHIDFDEPFERLFCQGMVCAPAYRADAYRVAGGEAIVPPEEVVKHPDGSVTRRSDGAPLTLEREWVPPEEVDTEAMVRRRDGRPVVCEMAKMSKSKMNGVAPDELFEQYGADTVHTYILFVGPADQDIEYSDQGLIGVHRFLNRFWDLIGSWADRVAEAPDAVEGDLNDDAKALRRKAHQTLGRVTDAFEPPFRFNTAIAGIMELANELRDRAEQAGQPAVVQEACRLAVQCLAPFAPHICEELWRRLGHRESVFRSRWPEVDEAAARAEAIDIPIQVNGKLRSRITVDAEADEQALEAAALADERVQGYLEGKTVRRVIVVPGRLVNLVVS
ncbi:MAG: leucine--tRNA ligase [Planctomycetota bacterium]